MKRIRLDGTDLAVSQICCGTATFGADLRGDDLDDFIGVYRDAGGNFFDTAHCYAFWLAAGAGCSECALGAYLRRNGKGDMVIGTKGGHTGAAGYRVTDHWLSPARIAADIDDSLGRLGLDVIDLFWLHRDDTRVTPGEVIEALNAEITRGRIRYLGASNWRADRIAAANAHAAAHGLRGFAANQPEWNLASKNKGGSDPATEKSHGAAMLVLDEGDLSWHRETRLPVVPYTSSAGGFFASNGDKARAAYDNPVSRRRLARVQLLASEMKAAPGQIATAWLINQGFPVFPIIGTVRQDHMKEALLAASIRLTPEQLTWLAAG